MKSTSTKHTEFLTEWLDGMYRAVRSGDVEAVGAYFAADCRMLDMAHGSEVVGLAAFEKTLREDYYAAFPDFTVIPERIYIDGRTIIVEVLCQGTYALGQEEPKPKVEWRGCALYTLADDKDQIVREAFYYDRDQVNSQLQNASTDV